VLVVDAGGIGGQARSSSLIRNYLGFAKGVSGSRLAEQAYEQASTFGASFLFMHPATALERAGGQLALSLEDGRTIRADAAILATGASCRRLGIPELETLIGAGVFYGGPASEAAALTGREVYVVGGGSSAGQAALHLARYARQVTLVVRRRSLGATMSDYLVRAIEDVPNLTVRFGAVVAGGSGDGHLEQVLVRDRATGEETWERADALFALIGADPLTDWLPPTGAGSRRLPADGRRSRRRVAARTATVRARDEHAVRACGRRRPSPLREARRRRRRRGGERGPVRPSAPRGACRTVRQAGRGAACVEERGSPARADDLVGQQLGSVFRAHRRGPHGLVRLNGPRVGSMTDA